MIKQAPIRAYSLQPHLNLLSIHVDDIILALGILSLSLGITWGWRACGITWRRSSIGIGRLANLHKFLLQILCHGLQQFGVWLGLPNLVLQGLQLGVNAGLEVSRHFLTQILELLLSLVHKALCIVLCLDCLLALLILCGIGLSILNHLLNIGLVQCGGASNCNGLLLACTTVLCGHVQNAVGIDVKRDFNLGHATRSRRHTIQTESAQDLVVFGELSLTLQHHNFHGWLRVSGSGEDLGFLGWDGGVPGDQHSGHTAKGLHTQRQRRHVQQHNVLHISGKHTSLDRSTDCHNLIRVHTLIGFLSANQL
mmetsp:Transcript_99210/g.121444  ORF Transcript_99210/g.121444 Transcript_99210/m.121444 type:complete len:309 (+) Transcript_99210:98-1024(+)